MEKRGASGRLDARLRSIARGELREALEVGGGVASDAGQGRPAPEDAAGDPSLASLVVLAFRAEGALPAGGGPSSGGPEGPAAGLVYGEEAPPVAPVYAFSTGFRSFEDALPARTDTLYRIASISKPSVALAAALLAERGIFSLDEDIGRYLDFPLRNPRYPETPITGALLLSHRSSLRDAESYMAPLGSTLEALILDRSAEGAGRRWYAFPPGGGFKYCNLGYGVVATAMERATGERFDRLMRRLVLGPLGIEGSFNLDDLSDEQFSRLGAIYRRVDPDGSWNPRAPWRPQCDAYRGARPDLPCRAPGGASREDLDAYVPGTNGTLFSPQGGLRASAADLPRLAALFWSDGAYGEGARGRRFCAASTLRRLSTPVWTASAAEAAAFPPNEATRRAGLGLMGCTAAADGPQGRRGDRLVPSGGPLLWGHHGNAYGLLGALLFDPERRYGFCYLIGGVPRDPDTYRGGFSSYSAWEEAIQRAIVEELFPA